MTTTNTRQPLAALAIVTLTIAGCSGTAGGNGSSSPGKDVTANHAKAVKFAECMRSNGISAFPDPDASGKLTIDAVANRSSLNPSTPAFKQALSACKALEPAGFTGTKRSPDQQQAALRFAQCVRDNGVPDFPDPVLGQALVDTTRIPSAATQSGMSILKAAMQRCSDFATAAGVTR